MSVWSTDYSRQNSIFFFFLITNLPRVLYKGIFSTFSTGEPLYGVRSENKGCIFRRELRTRRDLQNQICSYPFTLTYPNPGNPRPKHSPSPSNHVTQEKQLTGTKEPKRTCINNITVQTHSKYHRSSQWDYPLSIYTDPVQRSNHINALQFKTHSVFCTILYVTTERTLIIICHQRFGAAWNNITTALLK